MPSSPPGRRPAAFALSASQAAALSSSGVPASRPREMVGCHGEDIRPYIGVADGGEGRGELGRLLFGSAGWRRGGSFGVSCCLLLYGQYKQWVAELKGKIGAAQIKAAVTVNRQLLELYWELGREIFEKQRKANWGEALIAQLAKDLSKAFPGMKGFSRTNLFYIKKWYLFYLPLGNVPQVVGQIGRSPIVPQLVAQIPWGHNREIISKCATVSEALFYVRGTIENNWSRAVLIA